VKQCFTHIYEHYQFSFENNIHVFYLCRNIIYNNGFKEDDLDAFIPEEHQFFEENFPDDFVWSAATAAYQVEGGWNEGGTLTVRLNLNFQNFL
jgi:hypothetical protein